MMTQLNETSDIMQYAEPTARLLTICPMNKQS